MGGSLKMPYDLGLHETELVQLATAIIKSDYKSFSKIANSKPYSVQDLDRIMQTVVDTMMSHGLRVTSSQVESWILNLNSWGYDY
ncbi:hypothetical protein LIS04_11 [Listeria phage LIS04]|nr:hypothetical protein LIS04_11 [Listeria phage LIS04]